MPGKITLDRLVKLIEDKQLDPRQVKDLIDEIKYPGIRSQGAPVDLSLLVKKGKVRVGVVGDTQLNSVGSRLDYLHTLYQLFKEEGAQAVLHPGDFTDGHRRYEGHVSEVRYHSYEDIVKFIVEEYPTRGVPTYFIGGNDDRTYLTSLKRDICADVAERRTDLHYLGMNHARVRFDNVIVELNHPRNLNRGAYTISYPLQKLIECYKGGWKPNILLVGGYHAFYNLERRGIEAFLVGSTADPTATMMTKRHSSDCGGLILEINVNKEGCLSDLQWDIIPFYR